MIGLRIERRYVYVPRNDSPMLASPGFAAVELVGGMASAAFPSLMLLSRNMSAPAQKPRPGAGDDDRDDRAVRLRLRQRVLELRAHAIGPGIELLRPIQRDRSRPVRPLRRGSARTWSASLRSALMAYRLSLIA